EFKENESITAKKDIKPPIFIKYFIIELNIEFFFEAYIILLKFQQLWQS
ncbi:MAG: hypothetical protein ACI8RY_000855, partial [Urechidicola sp.]